MDKLTWILNHFITKDLYAPFTVKDDIDYYSDLSKKYLLLIKSAKTAGADAESIKILNKYTNKIKEAIRDYYAGKVTTSHQKIKNLVNNSLDGIVADALLDESKAFPGTKGTEIQFFRARNTPNGKEYMIEEMLHLPVDMRGKTGNYRFSIPGVPSLYLGNTSYACWLELGRPSEHDFNVSPIILDGTQRIYNLAVMTRNLQYLNECEEARVHCWLKLLCLMMATSYVVEEEGRVFKSEYIVSQSIMLACKELGLDGVAYFSKRVDDEIFAYAAINLALFAGYKKGKKYSELCEHIKIDDSFNYALFNQILVNGRTQQYNLRIDNTGFTTNIGRYKRQVPYWETMFHEFDKYMFASWKDKDKLSWGHAVL